MSELVRDWIISTFGNRDMFGPFMAVYLLLGSAIMIGWIKLAERWKHKPQIKHQNELEIFPTSSNNVVIGSRFSSNGEDFEIVSASGHHFAAKRVSK